MYLWTNILTKGQFRLEKTLFARADGIILTNAVAKHFIYETYKLSENIVYYIANYIGTELFKPLNMKKIRNNFCWEFY